MIRETLSGGLRAGLWTAAAPIFTDGPLVIVSLFTASWIATNPAALLTISALGAVFLLMMGIECFSIEPPTYDEELAVPTDSFKRGVITNLLNPNVYVFWFLIGGPLMASVAEKEPIAPIAYALTFLVRQGCNRLCFRPRAWAILRARIQSSTGRLRRPDDWIRRRLRLPSIHLARTGLILKRSYCRLRANSRESPAHRQASQEEVLEVREGSAQSKSSQRFLHRRGCVRVRTKGGHVGQPRCR